MVNNIAVRLDRVFGALADPTRRAIVARLARGEQTVTRLAGPFRISLPAISKHLKILERAGLIQRRIEGRVHHCALSIDALGTASSWIDFHRRFWADRLEALDALVPRTLKPTTRNRRVDH